MGAWGTSIFSDDTAADTRDAFTDFVAEGLTPAEATNRLIGESADILSDVEDAGIFWLALAATQWKLGRLIKRVRDRAIKVIDSGAELRRWQDNPKSKINQRKKHLARLRSQLLSPQPKPKKLKPFAKSSTDFKPGDVASFRLDEITLVRFCVLHLWGDRGGTYSDICLLGLEDGKPFKKAALKLHETLGPHYTMLSHEPAESITLLRRGVKLPEHSPETLRAWSQLPVCGHACTWSDFPVALRRVLPKLGWKKKARHR
jgi:hypothetical protein